MARAVSFGICCLSLLVGACSLEPIDIGRAPPAEAEPEPGEVTSGSSGRTWTVGQLEAGVVETVQLGIIDAEFHTAPSAASARRVAIELWPIEPTQLPADLVAVVIAATGEPAPAFSPAPLGLRFEAELELGWGLELQSEQFVELQVIAQFID